MKFEKKLKLKIRIFWLSMGHQRWISNATLVRFQFPSNATSDANLHIQICVIIPRTVSWVSFSSNLFTKITNKKWSAKIQWDLNNIQCIWFGWWLFQAEISRLGEICIFKFRENNSTRRFPWNFIYCSCAVNLHIQIEGQFDCWGHKWGNKMPTFSKFDFKV